MSLEPDRIATAQAMLAELGVTLADLHRAQRPPVPTMAEYLPPVMAAAGPGTRRTYVTYWQRMVTSLGAPARWTLRFDLIDHEGDIRFFRH